MRAYAHRIIVDYVFYKTNAFAVYSNYVNTVALVAAQASPHDARWQPVLRLADSVVAGGIAFALLNP